ncbi:predicted protein [Naegleria gruberi]|uniref:Predicted protein n=1 Tax=Naegleria gruberi TaxID=5762 RepID=D2VIY5_NAEGR|nr:uncharacterized protein NAEGRDRAFT_68842 [Naegleria gruberi]EFC43183.1 predicted protein [Naegleria gruberi]|eukprot:XP_002675927.1 predicted protein [Naegleria gruberi strain NEG-M]
MKGLTISNRHSNFKGVFETMAQMSGISIRFHSKEEEDLINQKKESGHFLNAHYSNLHSSTIGRYLARLAKLYPTETLNDATLSDEFVEIFSDLLKQDEISASDLEELFQYLENLLSPETDGFLVGGQMSWADIYLWKLLERVEHRFDIKRFDNVSTFKDILFKRLLNHEK